jgi:hypothetical protein
MEKLRGLDEDLRKNIAIEQEKNKVLSEQYGHGGKYLLYSMYVRGHNVYVLYLDGLICM